jgi:transcriptional regulator with XRE-family HTH domain
MRPKRNYSEIARATGLSVSFISRVFRGERNPSLASLITLAKAVDRTTDQLVKELQKGKRNNAKEENRKDGS